MAGPLVAGIDFGSALIKATTGDHALVFPAMVGEWNEGWSGMGGDDSWENNACIHAGTGPDGQARKQFFGELARTQSEVRRVLARGGTIPEVADVELAVVVSLVVLGIKTGRLDPVTTGIQDLECVITVGVPVSTSVDKMKQLSQQLKGTKELVLQNDHTKQVVHTRLVVTGSMVVYGPYGSYYSMLQSFNEDTAVDAVITDIGYGSAEILTIYEGRPNILASASIPDLSLETLADRIAAALQKQTGRIVKGVDLMRGLQKGERRLVIGGEALDITGLVAYYVEAIATSLCDEIIRLVSSLPPDARVKYYIFAGDGVDLFWKDLELVLFQKNLIRDVNQAAHPADYRFSNARGFEAIARARLARS